MSKGVPSVKWAEEGLAAGTEASYNVAPSQTSLIVRTRDEATRTLQAMPAKWGFVPSWAPEAFKLAPINAKAETVATNRMFAPAFKRRRCIVPVSGFYEWQAIPGQKVKQPWYITMADPEEIMPLAGIWEDREIEGCDDLQTSFTILTTEPNELMAKLHNRMPVILDPADFTRWLDAGAEVSDLLKPFPAEEMLAVKVSTLVNAPRNNSPECIEPILS